jgi:hypothetical protein
MVAGGRIQGRERGRVIDRLRESSCLIREQRCRKDCLDLSHVGHGTGHTSLPAACATPASSSRPVAIDVSASSRHSLHLFLWRWCRQMLCAPILLELASDALVRADARAPALLASAPLALVLADACPPALLASAPSALVRAQAYAPALLALAHLALVLADAHATALLASAPLTLVLADARATALLAFAPFALVRADILRLPSSLRRLLPLHRPPPVSGACGCYCCRRALPRQVQHAACCPRLPPRRPPRRPPLHGLPPRSTDGAPSSI